MVELEVRTYCQRDMIFWRANLYLGHQVGAEELVVTKMGKAGRAFVGARGWYRQSDRAQCIVNS